MRFYHLTLITPEGGRVPLEPEGSPLAALWRIRKVIREEPRGSVGVVSVIQPVREDLLQVRRLGDWVDTVQDAILGHLPAAQRDAILRAIDAFGGGEPDEHLLAAVIAAALAHGANIGAPNVAVPAVRQRTT